MTPLPRPSRRIRSSVVVLCIFALATGGLFVARAASANHRITLQDCPGTSAPTPPPSQPPVVPSPTPGASPAPACVISGSRIVVFTVSASQVAPIEAVDLRIISDTPGVPTPGGFPVAFPECAQRTTCTASYSWDTATRTPYNGTYHVRVTAKTSGNTGDTKFAETKAIVVDNPPAPPSRPIIVVATDVGVSLRWSEAVEPDSNGFSLERAQTTSNTVQPKDSAFASILVTKSTKALDDKVTKDVTYWYRLRSARRSYASPQGQIASAPGPVSAPARVSAPASPKPGTTGTTNGSKPLTRRQLSRLRLRSLAAPSLRRPAPVPDAPYSAILPYDDQEPVAGDDTLGRSGFDVPEEGSDPRGPVLPAAVGAFLVSAALAVGRLPRLDG